MARELPERPSLEHLKKEAKQLLRDGQAGDAGALARLRAAGAEPPRVPAKLSHAQFAVAREYGFASWPKMREHVVSLAEGADPARNFAAAVQAGDLVLVRAMLDEHPALKRRLNDTMPGLHFGGTPLIAAVNDKNREMVALLLGAGADINQKSHWWAGGFGVLDYATDLADYLIARGATLDACSAARLGRLDVLRAMVGADPRRVHERGGDGKTPLHWAATLETAEFLLENGADVNARDVDHESTPLQYLIREHQDVARLLVARGADADIFAAAALGDLERARRLLDADPSCAAMTVSRRSFAMQNPRAGGIIYIWTLGQHKRPHDIALEFGHGAVRELLMERSSPVLRLAIACEAGDESAIARLQEERPALTKSLPDELLYSVVASAMNNKTQVVRWMLRAGWPATAQEPGGVTALHWAAFHGNVEMARELLAHDASTEARDKTYDGRPIEWGEYGSKNSWHRETGAYEAMKMLLDPSV